MGICGQEVARGCDYVPCGKSLPDNLATIVATEGTARELARVEPSRRLEVLERAAESGKNDNHGCH